MRVLFKKYRYAFRSDRLFTEINYVVEKLKTQFLNLATILVDTYSKAGTEQEKRGTLKFLSKYLDIFHSLNAQEEQHDYFVDFKPDFINLFKFVMTLADP